MGYLMIWKGQFFPECMNLFAKWGVFGQLHNNTLDHIDSRTILKAPLISGKENEVKNRRPAASLGDPVCDQSWELSQSDCEHQFRFGPQHE